MNNLQPILKNLGVSEKEFLIYETLYKNGSMSVAELSKLLNTPRTTIYQQIDRLAQKGLVAQTAKGSTRHFIAELPVRFEALVKESKVKVEVKFKEIEQMEKSLSHLINHLEMISPNLDTLPATEIKYYEGRGNVDRVYDEILTYPEVKTYVNTKQISESFPDNFEKFNIAMNNGTFIYDLMTKDDVGKEFMEKLSNHGKLLSKFFPEGTIIDYMDYLIYGDSIAIIQGGSNPSAIVIHNKLLAANARTIYDVLWNLLPEPDKS